MSKAIRNIKGFTMIELMIVAIIVAILAVVLIPMMTGNKIRAYATECEAALGTIRTAMRVYHAENNSYNIGAGLAERTILGFQSGDLNGTYFDSSAYYINSTTNSTFTASCNWADSDNHPNLVAVSSGRGTSLSESGTLARTGY